MSDMDGRATYQAVPVGPPASTDPEAPEADALEQHIGTQDPYEPLPASLDIEAPEADAVEQHTLVRELYEPPRTSLPFDADEADAADQHRVVDEEEDDYR
jgi:hypothetical protein